MLAKIMVPTGYALHNTVFNEMHRVSHKYQFLKKKKRINKNTDFEVSHRKHNMKCNYAAQKRNPAMCCPAIHPS